MSVRFHFISNNKKKNKKWNPLYTEEEKRTQSCRFRETEKCASQIFFFMTMMTFCTRDMEPHARASTASWMTYSMVKKALDESIPW